MHEKAGRPDKALLVLMAQEQQDGFGGLTAQDVCDLAYVLVVEQASGGRWPIGRRCSRGASPKTCPYRAVGAALR
jgi:hypothetical protein